MSWLRYVIDHPDPCTEGVTRRGEYEPCDKPAVAVRLDDEKRPYAVCKHHTRGEMVPLRDLLGTSDREPGMDHGVAASTINHVRDVLDEAMDRQHTSADLAYALARAGLLVGQKPFILAIPTEHPAWSPTPPSVRFPGRQQPDGDDHPPHRTHPRQEGVRMSTWATTWSVRKRHLVGESFRHALYPMASAKCSGMIHLYPEGRPGRPIPAADSDAVMTLPACGVCAKKESA